MKDYACFCLLVASLGGKEEYVPWLLCVAPFSTGPLKSVEAVHFTLDQGRTRWLMSRTKVQAGFSIGSGPNSCHQFGEGESDRPVWVELNSARFQLQDSFASC